MLKTRYNSSCVSVTIQRNAFHDCHTDQLSAMIGEKSPVIRVTLSMWSP